MDLERIKSKIITVQGKQVILDSDDKKNKCKRERLKLIKFNDF